MFKSISWQEYLFVAGCLAVAYYGVAIAIFYSSEIVRKLKGAPILKAEPSIQKIDSSAEKFMGNISTSVRKKIPNKQSIASSEDLSIESDPEELLAANRADSPAADLLDALEEVFMFLASKKKEKVIYQEKIKRLFQQRPEFKGTPIQQEVIGFIQDYFKGNQNINFNAVELEMLWTDTKSEVIDQSTTKNNYEK